MSLSMSSSLTRDFRSSESSLGSDLLLLQAQKTQPVDFSQISTQEMSQNSSISLSQPTPGSKLSMYERWLSKKSSQKGEPTRISNNEPCSQEMVRPVISSETPKSGILSLNHLTRDINKPYTVTSFLSSRNSHKVKSDDKAERHFLEQTPQFYQELHSELKTGLQIIQEQMHSVNSSTNDQLTQTLDPFLGDLLKHEDRVMDMLEQKNAKINSTVDLERKLAKRDAEVECISNQLEMSKKDNDERFVKVLRNELRSPNPTIKDLLEEVLSTTKGIKENQAKQFRELKDKFDSQSKKCQSSYRDLKDMEKRIKKEIVEVIQSRVNMLESVTIANLGNELKSQLYRGQREIMTDIGKELHLDDLGKNIVHMVETTLRNLKEKDNYMIDEKLKDLMPIFARDVFDKILMKFKPLLAEDIQAHRKQLEELKGSLLSELSRYSQQFSEQVKKNHEENRCRESCQKGTERDKQTAQTEMISKRGNSLKDHAMKSTHYSSPQKEAFGPTLDRFCSAKDMPIETPGGYTLRPRKRAFPNDSIPRENEGVSHIPNFYNFSKTKQTPVKWNSDQLKSRKNSYTPKTTAALAMEFAEHQVSDSLAISHGSMPYVSPFRRYSDSRAPYSGPSPVATVLPQRQENTALQQSKQHIYDFDLEEDIQQVPFRRGGASQKRLKETDTKYKYKSNANLSNASDLPPSVYYANTRRTIMQRPVQRNQMANTRVVPQGPSREYQNKKDYMNLKRCIKESETLGSFLNTRNKENSSPKKPSPRKLPSNESSDSSPPCLTIEEVIIRRSMQPLAKTPRRRCLVDYQEEEVQPTGTPAPTLLSLLSKNFEEEC